MSDRTIEELKLIYEDLLLIRELVNELASKGRFKNIPLNGISGSEEKRAFFQEFIDKWEHLYRSGDLQSCEGKQLAAFGTECWIKIQEEPFNPLKNGKSHYFSHELYIGQAEQTNSNLDELIEDINKAIHGRPTRLAPKIINKQLDSIGANCNIAFIDVQTLEDAKALAFDPKGVTFLDDLPFHTIQKSKPRTI